MIYVSSDVVLSDISGDFRPNAPLVGYRTLLTLTSLTADEEATGYPVTNLANESTAEKWVAESTAEQYITVHLSSPGEADYLGIAVHNLGTAGCAVQLQISEDGDVWDDLGDDFLPGDDSAIMARFPVTTSAWWRLKLTPSSAIPQMAILYLGKLLVLQRNIQVGHQPMTYNYSGTISTGISESGQFLGAIMRRANPSADVAQKNLTPSWFRTYMAPFFKKCSGTDTDRHRTPFFFAWRPTDWPVEVAFGWFPEGGAPSVNNSRPNGMMDAAFQIQGML